MLPELTNLLPLERQKTLARDYVLRMSTLAFLFFALLIAVHALLLIPTYSYAVSEKEVQEERVAELSKRREVSGFTDISERVEAFMMRAKSLEELRTLPSVSDFIRLVLAVPANGITMTSFVWSAPLGGSEGSMRITGTAKTRESLSAFDRALQNVQYVRSTDLPLSAYAREQDIPFTITLLLEFSTP